MVSEVPDVGLCLYSVDTNDCQRVENKYSSASMKERVAKEKQLQQEFGGLKKH